MKMRAVILCAVAFVSASCKKGSTVPTQAESHPLLGIWGSVDHGKDAPILWKIDLTQDTLAFMEYGTGAQVTLHRFTPAEVEAVRKEFKKHQRANDEMLRD